MSTFVLVMDFNTKNIQQQYQGFLSTQVLWKDSILDLEQLILPKNNTTYFMGPMILNTRLGKRVESYVSSYLKSFDTIHIKAENIQVQKGNQTIGEIDCLLEQNQQPIHLEIIYKFYVYDASIGTSEIEHWIGPNKKDSLAQKLDKLKNKQLPLLFKDESKSVLKELHFNINKVQQKVLFKAQLFVPFANQDVVFKQLNSDCVSGFYINIKELEQFKDCKFYIPVKLDWLIEAHLKVNWLYYTNFKEVVTKILHQKTSPLCWMKQPNGEIFKFFLVWWKP